MTNTLTLYCTKANLEQISDCEPVGLVIRLPDDTLITVRGRVTMGAGAGAGAGLYCCGAVWSDWQVAGILCRKEV